MEWIAEVTKNYL